MKNLLFTFCSLIAFSQEKVQFLDSETIEPIAFATVVFGDGLGGYTNENGEFTFDKKQSFSVSMLGYKTLYVSETEFKNTIKLQSEPILIDEVIILNKKGKQKIVRQKPQFGVKSWFYSANPVIGSEIAVLIPNEKKSNTFLSKISIPVIKQPYKNIEINVDNNIYTTIRIRFYSNDKNQPDFLFFDEKIIVNIHNSNEKFFELNLDKYLISLPQNGLFVGLEFLGIADNNQKFIYQPLYEVFNDKGKDIKFSTRLAICLPITKKSNQIQTFIRYSDWDNNGQKKKWVSLTEDRAVNLAGNQTNDKGISNIGLGYELKVYE